MFATGAALRPENVSLHKNSRRFLVLTAVSAAAVAAALLLFSLMQFPVQARTDHQPASETNEGTTPLVSESVPDGTNLGNRITTAPSASDLPASSSDDPCIESVESTGTLTRSWIVDCLSENRHVDQVDGGLADRDYYARFFTFTLGESATVTISLTSDSDTFLYLMEGAARDGDLVDKNDDIDRNAQNYDSRIGPTELSSGDYTIEATTYDPDTTGSFTLTVESSSAGGPSDPSPTPSPTPMPSPTPGPSPSPQVVYTAISSGANHVCALASNGSIMCWGNEIGDGHGQVSQRPTTGVYTEINSGDNHTCALRNDGAVVCWGSLTIP